MNTDTALYVVSLNDTFSYQILHTLRRYQQHIRIKILYLAPDGDYATRYAPLASSSPVLAQCELFHPAPPDAAGTVGLEELFAASPTVIFQSVNYTNAPLFVTGMQRGAFRSEPLFLMLDDEIDRLEMREQMNRRGTPYEVVDDALEGRPIRHTPAMTEAYALANRFIVAEPFGRLLQTLLGRPLTIHDVILPITFLTNEHNPAREPLNDFNPAASKPFRLVCYTKSRPMRSWEWGFVQFLIAQKTLPAQMELTLFGPDTLAGTITQTMKDREGVQRAVVKSYSSPLPLSAYLELFAHCDGLLYQHRGGVTSIKNAVRNRTPLFYEAAKILTGNGMSADNYNLAFLNNLGIRSFGTVAEALALERAGELDAILAANKVALEIAELRSVQFFLRLFAPGTRPNVAS